MQSTAATVEQYLAELPADRRTAIAAVRSMILDHLDGGYEEGMQYGMIGYYVPHRLYPAGYHCDPKQPLPFACLASQKNYMAVYLMCVYDADGNAGQFKADWKDAGKKLDMGKSCIRFRKVDDLALDVLAKAIRQMPVPKWIAYYEDIIKGRPRSKARSVETEVDVVAAKSAGPSRVRTAVGKSARPKAPSRAKAPATGKSRKPA